MHFAPLTALLVMAPTVTAATGTYRCEPTDDNSWMTKSELTAILEEDGWNVRFIKEDGGCWEVYGTDSEGRRVEGYFHPATGAAQLISQRGGVLFRAED